MQRTCSCIGGPCASAHASRPWQRRPALLYLPCGATSAHQRAVASAACGGAVTRLSIERRSVRRSRVHGNRRSCTCGLSAHSRSTAGNNQRSCACVGGSECSGLAARRSRVHRSQRSCVCGRSCLSGSTAPASRCGSECSRWQAGGSDCSGLALACVAVNAADLQLHWQCIRRSRVGRDGGQQPAQLRVRRWQ